MTDRSLPDDELASAAIDGELTPDDAARVEAEPALRARRDELARAAEAVRAPVGEPAAPEREARIATAMAAFPTPGATAAVTPLAARRRLLPLAAAAAVLVVLAVGALVVRRGDDATTTVAKSTVTTAATTQRGAGPAVAAPAAGTAGAATSAGDAAQTTLDLGHYDDVDALAAAVRARLGGGTAGDTAATSSSSAAPLAESYSAPATTVRCAAPAAVPYPMLVADATLGGAPVHVFVGPDTQDRTLLVVLDASCAEVVSVAL